MAGPSIYYDSFGGGAFYGGNGGDVEGVEDAWGDARDMGNIPGYLKVYQYQDWWKLDHTRIEYCDWVDKRWDYERGRWKSHMFYIVPKQ